MKKPLKIFSIIVVLLVIGFQWVANEAKNQREAASNQETRFIRIASDNDANLFYVMNYSFLYDTEKLTAFSRKECVERLTAEKSCFIHYWVNENLIPEKTPDGYDNVYGLYEYVTYNGKRPSEEYLTVRNVSNGKFEPDKNKEPIARDREIKTDPHLDTGR